MKITSSNSVRVSSSSLGAVVAACIGWLSTAFAMDLRVAVKDQNGQPVENAVVWVAPSARHSNPVGREIVQKNRQFIPEVTIVPVNSTVTFPNRDTVQHHVYSFSPAKTFDFPLYIGESPGTVKLDKPGVVTLGCNIHDWMAAYIVVLDTDFYARTDAMGVATIAGLPSGAANVQVWHPRLRGSPVRVFVNIDSATTATEVGLRLRPAFRRTPPDTEGGIYP
ncbi:MAG TPA: methylamine utilization protein [Chthoniobacterales bacterium]